MPNVLLVTGPVAANMREALERPSPLALLGRLPALLDEASPSVGPTSTR
jgi:hypothetical protein